MKRPFTEAMIIVGCTITLLAGWPVLQAGGSAPVVHALIFFSPTCSHCKKVVSEDLPPMAEQYGSALSIVGVNVAQPGGQELYQAAVERFGIPNERRAVPTLIVGDNVLVGSREIPARLPGLVDHYLDAGGVDWPDLPGLQEVLLNSEPTKAGIAVAQPTSVQPGVGVALPDSPPDLAAPHDSWGDLVQKLARDPAGNALAISVMIGIMASIAWVGVGLFAHPPSRWVTPPMGLSWCIPVLCALGLVVAGYMAYVETAHVTATCGPVGDCNTVHQSEYVRLFGLLPIGVLGLLGYAAILLAWVIVRCWQGVLAQVAWLALLSMTAFGVLFSLYLTFLEPFVIGATCAWCLASAAIMTFLFGSVFAYVPRSSTGRMPCVYRSG